MTDIGAIKQPLATHQIANLSHRHTAASDSDSESQIAPCSFVTLGLHYSGTATVRLTGKAILCMARPSITAPPYTGNSHVKFLLVQYANRPPKLSIAITPNMPQSEPDP